MVPKILTIEQKKTRENVCTDSLNATENDANFSKEWLVFHL